MHPEDSSDSQQRSPRVTQMQSVADIAAMIEHRQTVLESAGNRSLPEEPTELYRPSRRPPFPSLKILDDGQRSAETVRIRKSPFVIGRSDADSNFPLDSEISGHHAELVLSEKNGNLLWCLRDLDNATRTFVLVHHAVLRSTHALILGDR